MFSKLLKPLYIVSLGMLLLAAGCGTAELPMSQVSGQSPSDPSSGQDTPATRVAMQTNKVQLEKAFSVASRIKTNSNSSMTPCFQNPQCISQQIDKLIIAAANFYLSKYNTVLFGTVGGVNSSGNLVNQVNSWTLANSSSGYSITQKYGNTIIQAMPKANTAGFAAGVTATGSLPPYAAGGVITIDVPRRLLAIVGADVNGYSYCYAAVGFVPVCAAGKW